MDYDVFKSKVKKSEPAPTPKPAPSPPPAPPSTSAPKPPSPPHQWPAHTRPRPGPIPFMGGGYMEEMDRMSSIPGMRNFEVTYSKTYRWNLTDPMEGYKHHYQDHGQPAAYRGMQRLSPPHTTQALPPRPPRRPLGPPPEYGPPGMRLAPTHHAYDNPYAPPNYGGYHHGPYRGGGGGGYYGDQHPEDCRVM